MSQKYLLWAAVIYFFVGMGLVIYLAIPKETQINKKTTKIETIDEESLSSSTLKKLKEKADKGELVQFGNIPVTVDKATLGKDNPFAP